MKRRNRRTDPKVTLPLGEILDHACGRAFVAGFLCGFAAGENGEDEPDLDDIEKRYQEAVQDSVLPIKKKTKH